VGDLKVSPLEYSLEQNGCQHLSFFFQGAIREAGGSFGKKEKAEEDQYFRRQEREQLEKMKKLEAEEKAKKKQEGKK
jgi:hypothetical protein